MRKSILGVTFCCLILFSQAQSVGIGTISPAASAKLEIASTTKGFLPPRMTAEQRIAISSPVEGLLVFQTNGSKGYYYFINGSWSRLNEEKSYPSLTICGQQWMDRNLDVTTYKNGDSIPYITNPLEWMNLTTGAWCYYNNDPSTNATYGKLYNWYAVNDPRGLAPVGWHIPSDDEWTSLETCLGGPIVAGGKLKVSGYTTWANPNTGADNSSGWAGLPGGFRSAAGTFGNIGFYGSWWSTTEVSATTVRYRYLVYAYNDIFREIFLKSGGLYVRCIRN